MTAYAARGAAGMAIAAVLAACGSPSPAAAPATPVQQVDVSMTEFRFSPSPIHAVPGPIVFRVVDAGRVGHDFTVLTPDGRRRLAHTSLVAPGGTATVRLDLSPGSYQVVCTQPGHQESGMEAHLEVGPLELVHGVPSMTLPVTLRPSPPASEGG